MVKEDLGARRYETSVENDESEKVETVHGDERVSTTINPPVWPVRSA